jgi:hypothetical protein
MNSSFNMDLIFHLLRFKEEESNQGHRERGMALTHHSKASKG